MFITIPWYRLGAVLGAMGLCVIIGDIKKVKAQSTNVPEIDLELFSYPERQLQKPIYAPFREEGTLRDATRPAYVVTKDEIKAQGARNAREALRLLPGVLNDGTVGTEVNALSGQFLRGAPTSRVSILLDGRAINSATSGGFDIGEIPADFIERVEVLPGGGSTLYGSDAIGGIINIITARSNGSKPLDGKVSFDVGNLGYNQQAVTLVGRASNLNWLIGYNRVAATNNYNFSIPAADFSGTRTNNDTASNNVLVRLNGAVSPRSQLSFQGMYLSKNQGSPGGVPVPDPQFGQGFFNSLTDNNRKYTDQVFTDLNYELKMGAGEDSLLSARLYYDSNSTLFDNRTTNAVTLSVVGGQVVRQNTLQSPSQFINRQRTFGSQLQHAWQLTPQQKLTYGLDYRLVNARTQSNDLVANTTRVNVDRDLSQGALFAQYTADLSPTLKANAGLRQEFSSLANGSVTAPAVGLKWDVTPSTSLRANYAYNYRTPSITELFSTNPTNIGNPNLLPESGDSFDVGIDQKIGTVALLRLTAYQNNITNTVAFQRLTPPVGGATGTYTNIGFVKAQGLEASLNAQLAPHVFAYVNYTLNSPRIENDANPAIIGREVRFVGADKLGIGIAYEHPSGWYVGVGLNSLSGYPTNNQNTESLPGYTTINANALIPLQQDRSLNLNLGIQNLLEQRYQLFSGFPDAGRTITAGIDWKF